MKQRSSTTCVRNHPELETRRDQASAGLSQVAEGRLRSRLRDEPWRPLITKVGLIGNIIGGVSLVAAIKQCASVVQVAFDARKKGAPNGSQLTCQVAVSATTRYGASRWYGDCGCFWYANI